VAEKRRAIRADIFDIVAHIAINVRMIEWRQCADTHKLPRADLDDRDADIVMKMGDDRIRHAPFIRVLSRARTIAGRDGDFQQGNFIAMLNRPVVKKPRIAPGFARAWRHRRLDRMVGPCRVFPTLA
jgi:hypothetical protein